MHVCAVPIVTVTTTLDMISAVVTQPVQHCLPPPVVPSMVPFFQFPPLRTPEPALSRTKNQESDAAEALLRLHNRSPSSPVSSSGPGISSTDHPTLPPIARVTPSNDSQLPPLRSRTIARRQHHFNRHPCKKGTATSSKPRWQDDERLDLLHAIIREKQLDEMTSFQWSRIADAVGRPRKACKDQWRREILPALIKSLATGQEEQTD